MTTLKVMLVLIAILLAAACAKRAPSTSTTTNNAAADPTWKALDPNDPLAQFARDPLGTSAKEQEKFVAKSPYRKKDADDR